MTRLKNAWHNIVIHPIAGVCWLFGFEKLGDRIHGKADRDFHPWLIREAIVRLQAEKSKGGAS